MASLTILPVHYQSYGISVSDWITLFTLCLAPLFAQLISGTPQPSYLHTSRPKWHDRLVLYNPTSILWRYAIIADRRIRAWKWDKVDLAASNALFWTADGWDGSEAIVDQAMRKCTFLPESARSRCSRER